MKQVILTRVSMTEKAVYGVLSVIIDGSPVFICPTIENASKSFPDGEYDMVFEYSPRFKTHLWELKGIKGRAEIKIHTANYYDQLDGCIGVGMSVSDINEDGTIDIAESKKALAKFHYQMAPEQTASISVKTI